MKAFSANGTIGSFEIRVIAPSTFGRTLAERIENACRKASESGRKLLFDMPTGSTPKPAWPIVAEMIADGRIDPSDVIVIGHEEAWGTFEPGSKPDFDAYRQREWFERNGLTVRPITTAEQAKARDIAGNFVPMRLSDDPVEAADTYNVIVRTLMARKDVATFALLGIGTEGHVAEFQPHDFPLRMDRCRTYVNDIRFYSVEAGAFRWADDEGGFHPEENIFWDRNAEGEDVGRAVSDGYLGIKSIAGIGWNDLLDMDVLEIAFNGPSKALALRLALEGSGVTRVENENGRVVSRIVPDLGEDESIVPTMQAYARRIGVKRPEALTRYAAIRDAILAFLRTRRSTASDTWLDRQYETMWGLANRFHGKRAPVARLLWARMKLGKTTTLVVSSDTVADGPLAL